MYTCMLAYLCTCTVTNLHTCKLANLQTCIHHDCIIPGYLYAHKITLLQNFIIINNGYKATLMEVDTMKMTSVVPV